jgi:hypothetical protein
MRFELVIMLIAGLIMGNIYTEGKYLKMVLSGKKYMQMVGVAIGALCIYWLFKKNPEQAHKMLVASNEYIKYLPVDRNTTNMISPILNFSGYGAAAAAAASASLESGSAVMEERIRTSGRGGTKRSVSETKKKFVASGQNWRCGGCGNQLNAWFEVDHKIRLEDGGSNHVDNLMAVCRECHGKKTAMENL